MWPNCADCCNTWLRSDHIATQNSSRCDLANPVQITMYEDTEMWSVFTCSFTYFLFCFCFFLSLPFFILFQVAQWPEKKEEEQPMFGEEYDWWVTDWKGWECRTGSSYELVPNHLNHLNHMFSGLSVPLDNSGMSFGTHCERITWQIHASLLLETCNKRKKSSPKRGFKEKDDSRSFNCCKMIISSTDGNLFTMLPNRAVCKRQRVNVLYYNNNSTAQASFAIFSLAKTSWTKMNVIQIETGIENRFQIK